MELEEKYLTEKYLEEKVKNPQLWEDLMDIHILLSQVSSFMPIKDHIDNLEMNHPNDKNYKKIQKQTRTLLNVLKAFAKNPMWGK